jgi:hypothetical protein
MLFLNFFLKCCKNTTISKFSFLLPFLLIINTSCSIFDSSKEKDDAQEILKKERFEPNVFKRAEKSVEKSGSIFSGGSNRRASEFGADSVIWQASLKTMEDIPLSQVNYTGGVIVSDWYSGSNSNESIKISIFIKSPRLETSSIEVKSFKKICVGNENCKTSSLENDFNNSVKNKILVNARAISVEKKTKE